MVGLCKASRFSVAALLLVGALSAVVGCGSSDVQPSDPHPDRTYRLSEYGSWVGHQTDPAKAEPAPAPAPAPRQAPAPAPAPSTGNAMYLPTGERSTSAVMLEKLAPGEVVVGQSFDYELRVTNLTNLTLSDVLVEDTLPGGFRVGTAEPRGTAGANNMMSWELGEIGPRASKSIKVSGSASAAGTLRNCVGVTWNNALCVTTNVVQPALQITKKMPSEVLLCDTIPVEITVTNTGSGAARAVKVRDALPAGLAAADGKTNVEFDAGTLASKQSRTFNFNAKASKTGQFSNQANAAAEGNLSAQSAAVSVTVRQPVLELKAECPGAQMIGRNATIKFTASNKGDAACRGTVLTAPLPSGSTFVSADTGGTAGASGVTWNLGEMAAGSSKTVSMTVRTSGAGQIAASGTVNCACATAASANCSFGVQGVPDIGTLVTDNDGVVMVGENHTYTCEVKNQGQVNLTSVKMVVTIPAGIDFVASQFTPAAVIAGRTITFNVGTLPAGATKTWTFTAKATAAGEMLIVGETTCTELKNPVRDDELTNFVSR